MIVLDLPMPPSTNGLYRNSGKKRFKTRRYRTWLNAAGHDVTQQPCQRHLGHYSISVYICPRDKRKRDVDNHLKAISDLLVEHRLVEDDSLAQSAHVEWCAHIPKGRALVHIGPPIVVDVALINRLKLSLKN